MDARIDVLAVLGLHLGEAHVVRNAGGRVTGDVLRSLALSSGVLGVDTVVIMQHTGCGLAGVTDEELRRRTGSDLDFLPIADHAAALRADVDTLARTPYLSGLRTIAGFVYDVESGELGDVVRWERREKRWGWAVVCRPTPTMKERPMPAAPTHRSTTMRPRPASDPGSLRSAGSAR